MVKRRPAIIISPRLRYRDGLCTVVPLSQSVPAKPQAYHYELVLKRPLPGRWESQSYWVKADMLATVSFRRLELFRIGRDHEGKRKYLTNTISDEYLINIRQCVLHALGISSLISHL
jgi:uncharacterized protein YifN (PemK superfamily)